MVLRTSFEEKKTIYMNKLMQELDETLIKQAHQINFTPREIYVPSIDTYITVDVKTLQILDVESTTHPLYINNEQSGYSVMVHTVLFAVSGFKFHVDFIEEIHDSFDRHVPSYLVPSKRYTMTYTSSGVNGSYAEIKENTSMEDSTSVLLFKAVNEAFGLYLFQVFSNNFRPYLHDIAKVYETAVIQEFSNMFSETCNRLKIKIERLFGHLAVVKIGDNEAKAIPHKRLFEILEGNYSI